MQGSPKGNPSGKVAKADVGRVNAISPLFNTLTTASSSNLVLTANSTSTGWTTLTNAGFVSSEMDEICERLDKIEERLIILLPNLELHDKFPALRRAYEDYLILEKLINGKRDKGST